MNAAPEPVEPMVVVVEVETEPAGVNVWEWFRSMLAALVFIGPALLVVTCAYGPPPVIKPKLYECVWFKSTALVVPALPEKLDEDDEDALWLWDGNSVVVSVVEAAPPCAFTA